MILLFHWSRFLCFIRNRSGRVWANAWDVFPRMRPQVGRGRRAAVDFVVCFGWGGFFFRVFFPILFSFERTRPAASMRPPCLIHLSTSTETRPRERSDRSRFLPKEAKKPFHTGVRKGCHYLISLCVTFVVCTDSESCTRPISTNPGSMEAGEHGLTREARFVTVCLEVVAVAWLMWVSWCVFGGADCFIFFFSCFFFLRTHTSCCKYVAVSCLIYLSTSNEARPRERSDRGRFLP